MSELRITLQQLRGMIGLHVVHQGIPCQIIEVLDDGPAIVLQSCNPNKPVQSNQHGEGNRRVQETFTVPVLTRDKYEFHPQYLALELP
ncbi:hypothetical protein [Thiohalophilus thiocyanatoxydans]|uniref:Uncharacterized protein n=1 Tax=Thiohalophilus thiocyanatoxydans TaxID=381308 RepID=A0A4R8IU29_9GAMM|nr:hypothetical protein [Thiohalophilus thiocyanatoxydans]TDY02940.1 hypothetical protein EDC23_1324 [Thiohalophilus thiocyanatoxydans]